MSRTGTTLPGYQGGAPAGRGAPRPSPCPRVAGADGPCDLQWAGADGPSTSAARTTLVQSGRRLSRACSPVRSWGCSSRGRLPEPAPPPGPVRREDTSAADRSGRRQGPGLQGLGSPRPPMQHPGGVARHCVAGDDVRDCLRTPVTQLCLPPATSNGVLFSFPHANSRMPNVNQLLQFRFLRNQKM